MHTQTAIIVAAAGMLSVAPLAHADVLVDNIDHYTGFTIALTGYGSDLLMAAKFTTGADAAEVFNATAFLSNQTGFGNATYRALIYTSSGSTPDTLVASFDTTPLLSSGTPLTDVVFESTDGIALEASTDYWLAIRNTTGSYFGWGSTYRNTETSDAGWTIDNDAVARSINGASTWTDQSGFYGGWIPQFSLGGSVVPTPGALALLGIGGLVSARRRRV